MSDNEGKDLFAGMEDGYTYIPNDIFDAVMVVKIHVIQLNMCMHLLRYTYGCHKEWAAISLHDFAAAMDSNEQWLLVMIESLINRKIIICQESKPGENSFYKINPEVSEWKY